MFLSLCYSSVKHTLRCTGFAFAVYVMFVNVMVIFRHREMLKLVFGKFSVLLRSSRILLGYLTHAFSMLCVSFSQVIKVDKYF